MKRSAQAPKPKSLSKSPPQRQAQKAAPKMPATKYINKVLKQRIKQYKAKEKQEPRKVKKKGKKEAQKESTAQKQETKKQGRGARALELTKPKHHLKLYTLFSERLRTRPLRKANNERRARSVLLPKRVSMLGKAARCCSSHDASVNEQSKMLLFIQGSSSYREQFLRRKRAELNDLCVDKLTQFRDMQLKYKNPTRPKTPPPAAETTSFTTDEDIQSLSNVPGQHVPIQRKKTMFSRRKTEFLRRKTFNFGFSSAKDREQSVPPRSVEAHS